MSLTIQDWGMLIGQEISVEGQCTILDGIEVDSNKFVLHADIALKDGYTFYPEECKPILRTFDQMNADELDIIITDFGYSSDLYCDNFDMWMTDLIVDDYNLHSKLFKWFIQHGFDVFKWIDSGLALKKEE